MVFIMEDALGGHAAIRIDRGPDGIPHLFDPGGSYVPVGSSRPASGVFDGAEADPLPYERFHMADGSSVTVYYYNTSEDEEVQLYKAFLPDPNTSKDPGPLYCSFACSLALKQLERFDNLDAPIVRPSALGRALQALPSFSVAVTPLGGISP
jgi:hypothetical protein